MKPANKIKQLILLSYYEDNKISMDLNLHPCDIDEVIEFVWNEIDSKHLQSYIYELREGDFVTDIIPDWSRLYECRSVAAKMHDGSFVGWDYWYGGGKHEDPDSIDWISDAYNLDIKEEEKLVIVKTFTKL